MVNVNDILVVIPARGGSKGVLNKNIKKLNGIPLILYTLKEARKIFTDSQICVSTDSNVIKGIIEKEGLKVPFLRPENISGDSATSESVLLHAINWYKNNGVNHKIVILLQPTSPLRNSSHIIESLNLYNEKLDMVVSVKKTQSNPYYIMFEENNKGFLKKIFNNSYKRRQDCPDVWEYNGAIYIINIKSLINKNLSKFNKIKKYAMDEICSIDIDTELDFNIASLYMKK